MSTLAQEVAKESGNWVKGLAFPWYRKFLFLCTSHPIKCGFTLFLCFGLLSLGMLAYSHLFEPLVHHEFAREQQISYFGQIWSVQVTLAAIVYPIVISFVAINLQRSGDSRKASISLKIYLRESAAAIAGISAIFLIGLMSLQYATFSLNGFLPSNRMKVVLSQIDLIWLMLNLFLTVNFLWVTFRFIEDSGRNEIIRNHMRRYILPKQILAALKTHIVLLATEKGLVASGKIDSLDRTDPVVAFGPMFSDQGDEEVISSRWIVRNRYLKNVNFARLDWVSRRWMKKIGHDGEKQDQAFLQRSYLIFPVVPQVPYKGKIVICRLDGSRRLDWIEKLAVRSAYRFTAVDSGPQITVDDLLREKTDSAVRSVDTGNLQLYREEVDGYIEALGNVIVATCYTDNDGDKGAFVHLGDGFHFQNFAEKWVELIRDLSEAATRRFEFESGFYLALVHSPYRLLLDLRENGRLLDYGIAGYFIEASYHVFYPLHFFWKKKFEVNPESNATTEFLSKLAPGLESNYRSAIVEWLGAFEAYAYLLLPNGSRSEDRYFKDLDESERWLKYNQCFQLNAKYLESLSSMLLSSIRARDFDGSKAFFSSLCQWKDRSLMLAFQNTYTLEEHGALANANWLERDWRDISEELGFEGDGLIRELQGPELAFAQILSNFWKDISLSAAYIAIEAILDAELLGSRSMKLVRAMVGKEGYVGLDGESDSLSVTSDMNSFFHSVLRQFFSDNHNGSGHSSKINHFISKFERDRDMPWIPGRIRSRSGDPGLPSKTNHMLLIASCLCSENWSAVGAFDVGFDAEYLKTNSDYDRFVRTVGQWKECLDSEKFVNLLREFSRITDEEFDQLNLNRKYFSKELGSLLGELHNRRSQELLEREVTDERLLEYARYADLVRDDFESSFPFNLFSDFSISSVAEVENEEDIETYTLRIKSMNKGLFTEPLLAQPASNEESFIHHSCLQHISAYILGKVLNLVPRDRVEATQSNVYWDAISNRKQRWFTQVEKKTPLLLLEGLTEPRWLYEWIRGVREADNYQKPADIQITRNEKYRGIREYVASVNEIDVFAARIWPGSSVLIAEDSFRKLQFLENPEGNLATVDYEVTDNPEEIDLIFEWRIKISVDKTAALELVYGDRSTDTV